MMMDKFTLHTLDDMKDMQVAIQLCQENNHVQQVAYGTYHDCLTQICFSCMTIYTNMKEEDMQ